MTPFDIGPFTRNEIRIAVSHYAPEDHKTLQSWSVQVNAIWSCNRLLQRTKPLTCSYNHFSTIFITFVGEYGFSVFK